MYCNQCGTRLDDGIWTCPRCGHDVPESLRALLLRSSTGTAPTPHQEARPQPEEYELLDSGRSFVPQEETLPLTPPNSAEAAAHREIEMPASPDKAEAGTAAAATPTRAVEPESSEVPVKGKPRSRRRRGCGWAMIAGMLAGCALLIMLSVGGLAVYQGLQERTRLNRAAAAEHYQRGLEQLAASNYELARAELEMAVALDPRNRDAEAKLIEVNSLVGQLPTPTSAVRRQTAVLLYNEARELYNQGDWEGAAAKLEQVRSLDADYEPDKVTELLFESSFKAGQKLVGESRMEEAIRYFDHALALRPSDVTVRDQKRYASLYLAGIGYWGANWQGAIDTFTALYQLQPNYLDTKQRLFDAHVEFGDYLLSKDQWCNARDQYNGALSYSVNAEVVAKRESAEQLCIQGALPTATPAPSGAFVGRLVTVEDVASASAMMIRGYVKDAQGQPIPNIQVGLSAFDWNASPAMTNGEGLFAFDGLGNPVTYTLTLLDLPSVPLSVKADWSKLAWVEFQARP